MKPRSIASHLVSLKASTPQLHKLGRFTTSKNEQQNNHCKRRVGKPTSTTRLDTPLSLPSQIEGRGRISIPSNKTTTDATPEAQECPPPMAVQLPWTSGACLGAQAQGDRQHRNIPHPTRFMSCAEAPDPTPPCTFRHHVANPPQASARSPEAGTQHRNIPHPTRFMPHARRHPAPPHRARSAAAPPALPGPPGECPRTTSNTTTSHARQGSCRTPEGTRPHPTVHVQPPCRPPSSGLRPPRPRPKHMPMCGALCLGRGRGDIGVPPRPAHAGRSPPYIVHSEAFLVWQACTSNF